MSEVIAAAVAALNEKIAGDSYDGTARFKIMSDGQEEGTIMLSGDGAYAGDGDADVTMIAETDVFQSILAGELNPTAAFMTGKLKVEGDMGAAMRLGSVLA